jgi:predicted transcriptional regulator
MLTKTAPTAAVPRNLRKALDERELSQTDLARATGINPAEISRMCNRGMKPTRAQARRIAEVLEPARDGASA